jgi:MFS family permease
VDIQLKPSGKLQFNKHVLALMAVYFIAAAGGGVNPILQRIIQAFPNVSVPVVRLISTLPSFFAMTVSLIIGATVGRKIKFRTVVIIGIIAWTIGGLGPAVFHSNIVVILCFRALFGVGLGCLMCRTAFILSAVSDKTIQTKLIGSGQMVGNFGGASMSLLSGFLADMHWTYAFYPYIIAIIPLILEITIVIPETLQDPKKDAASGAARNEASGAARNEVSSGRMGRWFLVYALFQLLTMMNAQPVMTGMSTMITARNLGTASTTAVILAICSASGIIAGAIYGSFYARLKRFALPVAMFIQGIGVFFILIFYNVPLITLGAVLSGVGTILLVLLYQTYAGQSTGKLHIAMAISIITTCGQIASFVSSFYFEFANRLFRNFYTVDAERVYLLGSIVFGALTVLMLIFDFGPRPPQVKRSALAA